MNRILTYLTIIFVTAGCGEIIKNPDGSSEYNYFFPNGTLKKQKTFNLDSNGNEVQFWKFYYESGNLKKEGKTDFFNKSNGLWKFYYESGKIKSETEYKNDVRHGYAKYYREDGSLQSEGNYVNGNLDGKWNYWKEDGSISFSDWWDNGEEVLPTVKH